MTEQKKLSVAIAAGGTAGHINPALALAEELHERGHRLRFLVSPTSLKVRWCLRRDLSWYLSM